MKEFKLDLNSKLDEQVLLNAAIVCYMKDTLNASNEEIANLLYVPEEKIEMYYNNCGRFINENTDNINYQPFNEMYSTFIAKNDVHDASRLYRNVSSYGNKGGRRKVKGNYDSYWEQRDVTVFPEDLLKQLAEAYYYNVFCNVSTGKISEYFVSLSQPTIAKYLSVCVPKILGLNDDAPAKQFFTEALRKVKRNHTPEIQAQIIKSQAESTNTLFSDKIRKVTENKPTPEKKEKIIEVIKTSTPSFELVLNELVDIEIRLHGIHNAIKSDPDYYLDHCLRVLTQAYSKLNTSLDEVSAKEYRSKIYNDQFLYVLKAASDKLANITSLFNTLVMVTSDIESTISSTQKKEEVSKLMQDFHSLITDIKGE